MKILLNWIKEFVDIPVSVSELAHRLTLAGLEVEMVKELGLISDSIKVVQILKMEKHPQADRLTVCQVSLGQGEPLQIVCGAKNMKEGDCVPLALPGTVLPDGKVISSSELRGVKSNGMLCSEQELALLEESSGLFILPQGLKLGQPLCEALPLRDTLFEINVTPNRADCLSIYGFAREISAILNVPLKKIESPTLSYSAAKKDLLIQVEDKKACSLYCSQVLRGVKIKASPWYIRLRLMQMGLRAINHVVDATNYVLLELGQPLHAFDLDKISSHQLSVKKIEKPQTFVGLDEVSRNLIAGDLVICDGEKILALAGVMGASNSGVEEVSQNLLLEAAYFEETGIRKTSKRLGLQTDSSYRFERGVDPLGVKKALKRLAELLNHEGVCLEEAKEFVSDLPQQLAIELRVSKIKQILGFDISNSQIEEILNSLQMKFKFEENVFEVIPPSYRVDLLREIDLIEEIARLYGYEKIPEELPRGQFQLARDASSFFKDFEIKQMLKHLGFVETIHYSFTSPKLLNLFTAQDAHLNLANPLSEDMSQLRNFLLPQLLENLSQNFSNIREDQKLFELRSVFCYQDKIIEKKHLSLAILGQVSPLQWGVENRVSDFYDIKAVVEALLEELHLTGFEYLPSSLAFLHPGLSAELMKDGKSYGFMGALHPSLLKNFNFAEQTIWVAELDLQDLLSLPLPKQEIKAPSKFPPIRRDVTLWAPENFEAAEILKFFSNQSSLLLKQVELKYVYRGEPVEAGKKALTYSLCYQSDEKTLTDLEVGEIHEKNIQSVLGLFPLQWR